LAKSIWISHITCREMKHLHDTTYQTTCQYSARGENLTLFYTIRIIRTKESPGYQKTSWQRHVMIHSALFDPPRGVIK
jgi:hypothetical protein